MNQQYPRNPTAASVKRLVEGKNYFRHVEPEVVNALAASIQESKGIIRPILVMPVPGGYEILDGVLRLRAAKQLGLDIVPIKVVSREESDYSREIQAIMNIDWVPLETDPEVIIHGMERLVEHFGAEAAELVVESLDFMMVHNPQLTPEQKGRVEAVLSRCQLTNQPDN
ncbi:ParB/RepB/Spo0J family partition protein [Pseudomonas aeruginosa]